MLDIFGEKEVGAPNSIAITGVACRLPGARDMESLWDLLVSGSSAIRSIPGTRWALDPLYAADRKAPGRTVNRQAGLIEDIDCFDAGFFGISAREAAAMDPQQRIILEESWHALEDAGYAPDSLHGEKVGVFAATMANDYQQHLASPFRVPDGYSALGSYSALLANRVSSFFGWRGESVSVDTACASSLAALHQARRALLSGSVDLCLVAAANAILSPWKAISFSQAGMLSADGLCKTFAEGADGYVPGEGVVVLVLRRTTDALNTGDRIHGLVLGTAINHMGPSPSITAPSVEAEAALIHSALGEAGVDPALLSYIEAHGTGTAIGDPIELEALARVLPPKGDSDLGSQAYIGSIKTNLGHLEAASGLAGIAKVLLMMRHRQIPPTLNLERDNPLIDFSALTLEPARQLLAWTARPMLAGISAFGFGGAGAHAVLAEPPPPRWTEGRVLVGAEQQAVPLLFSAADETALKVLTTRYSDWLKRPTAPALIDLGQALKHQRGALRYRAVVQANTIKDAANILTGGELDIKRQPETAPRLALRLELPEQPSAWREAQDRLPSWQAQAMRLQKKLGVAGLSGEIPRVFEYCNARALVNLLLDCGLKPDLFIAAGSARTVALAASGAMEDEAAAFLAAHHSLETHAIRRPLTWYYDGDTGITLAPVHPSPASVQALLDAAKSASSGILLKLGKRLWDSNHTFRARLDEWRDILGVCPGQMLMQQASDEAGINTILALATAASIWRTCRHWSLRAPQAATQWPGWPLAGLIADGLIPERLAVATIEGRCLLQDLITALTSATRLPAVEHHPWLDRQRTYLPELIEPNNPLSERNRNIGIRLPWTPDIVLTIGSPALASQLPVMTAQQVVLDPADGAQALDSALSELWHAGIDIDWRRLGGGRPCLNLPLYPFTQRRYWLSRLPQGDKAELWETGQQIMLPSISDNNTQIDVDTPPQVSEPGQASTDVTRQTDLIDQIRRCVADTLEATPEEIDPQRSLKNQGLDSLVSMDLITRIERSTGVRLYPGMLEELQTVTAIAERVSRMLKLENAQTPDAAASVAEPSLSEPVAGAYASVSIGTPGLLDTIRVDSLPESEPGPGQVLLHTQAAGLNFRDVMTALGALADAAGDPLGLEFCGTVSAVGTGVNGVQPGARMFGVGFGALAEQVITAAELVRPAPSSLGDAQVAALPIAYLTAMRCLEHIGALAQGQTVLIHCASGGLGQAAVHVAQARGARILASAGSPEKRAWLAEQGIDTVMDSRSLAFSDQALAATGGRGVDLLLNVLTGAAIEHGLDCLATGGVFIELGKTDIREPDEISWQRPDVRYVVYDLVREMREQAAMTGDLLAELAERIERGVLPPLPVETFALDDAASAFSHMARARHRGKIVMLTNATASATEQSTPNSKRAVPQSAATVTGTTPLAIVGLSGRFPGAADCDALWQLFREGRSAISEVPTGRWSDRDIELFAGNASAKARQLKGGFLADADCFDHAFFGFSPREAKATDPRQRLLLEETWKALHDAGLHWSGPGESLREQNLGVFIACDAGDYGCKCAAAGNPGDQLALAGTLPSSLAARLAHVFDLDGPALTLDMACSSSIAALWAARQALLQGDCRSAVLGAVSVHSTPLLVGQLAATDLLSQQDRCLPFTCEADGFLPSEACISLIIKPLDTALADGDRIHALIRAVGTGHDGAGGGFTKPSPDSQTRLQRNTLAQAGLTPADIDLVEAHGVGSRAGDAAEILALAKTFAVPQRAPLPLTSVKPLLGHTLAAAGLTALVHAILQLRRGQLLAAGLKQTALIPELANSPLYIPDAMSAWPSQPDAKARRVMLNVFAINGSNGVVILEEAPPEQARPTEPLVERPSHTLQRRRFWPGMEMGNAAHPPPADANAAGLRTELAELLQEDPERIDLSATPLEIGLESILAIELQHRLQRRFGVRLALEEILAVSRLADMLASLDNIAVSPSSTAEPQLPVEQTPFEPFALSDLQAAYWSGRHPEVPLGGTDCQVYWEFECAQPWSAEALESAWNRLLELHPMLRAVVDENGRQRVLAQVRYYRFDVHDWRGLSAELSAQKSAALRSELSRENLDPESWPLFRIAFSLTPDHRRLHVVLNLMLVDVLSLYSLLDQLAALASDPNTTPDVPALSFRQCLLAMQDARHSESWRRAETFWQHRGPELPPSPQLPLSTSYDRRLSTRRLQSRLPQDIWQEIVARSRAHQLSPSVAVLAVFAAVLSHWTRQPRFTLNLTTHARPPIHAEINRVIGNFTSTVLLDIDAETAGPFSDFAYRVGQRLLEHLSNAEYPGVRVLRRRAAEQGWQAGIMPVVFTSMLGYDALRGPTRSNRSGAPLIGTLVQGATRTPQVSLDAQVQEDSEGLLLSWDVAEGLFSDGLMETVFEAWVDGVATLATTAGWQRDIAADIAMREAQQRAEANSDTAPLPQEPLYGPFLQQAAAHPQGTAVITADRTLDYQTLAALAADLAATLGALQPGELVAVAMDRGWRQVVAVIAIQMAGAAYLPLAPEQPTQRFTHLAKRGAIRIGITENGRRLPWPEGTRVIEIATDAQAQQPALPTDFTTDPDSLAYVIFTSGSTGEPKGVMLSHRAALNTCLDINRRFALKPSERVLAVSALSFDLSVWDIFGTLAGGGTIVIPAPESANDPDHLSRLIRDHRVSIWNSVPMYLELLLAGEPAPEALSSLRVVMLSGDWIPLGLPGRLRAVAPQAQVHSLGGATEAAIWSIHYPIEPELRPGWTSIPYGRAMANQSMQILDEHLQPCPDCVPGELYIGGAGLALGYWADPERTAAAFISHPQTGERLYKTGDLARWREEGLIEFLGRRDGQVKIDGHRVELGEIEAALRRHPAVREAVAVAPTDKMCRRWLAAFCLVDGELMPDVLLVYLRSQLPSYMVPQRLRIVERFPLTDNDKVDRRALMASADTDTPLPESSHPTSTNTDIKDLQQRMIRLWSEVLAESGGRAPLRLDPERNLFEFGADSLVVVAASRRISREFGVSCSVTEIFEQATIARLTQVLAARMVHSKQNPVSQAGITVAVNPVRTERAHLRRALRASLN